MVNRAVLYSIIGMLFLFGIFTESKLNRAIIHIETLEKTVRYYHPLDRKVNIVNRMKIQLEKELEEERANEVNN